MMSDAVDVSAPGKVSDFAECRFIVDPVPGPDLNRLHRSAHVCSMGREIVVVEIVELGFATLFTDAEPSSV